MKYVPIVASGRKRITTSHEFEARPQARLGLPLLGDSYKPVNN